MGGLGAVMPFSIIIIIIITTSTTTTNITTG
jgi:hypothetical protein